MSRMGNVGMSLTATTPCQIVRNQRVFAKLLERSIVAAKLFFTRYEGMNRAVTCRANVDPRL